MISSDKFCHRQGTNVSFIRS